MIFSLARKLPKPVRNVLRWVYDKWRLRIALGKESVENIAEYFSLSKKETKRLLRSGRQLNADLWKVLGPKSKDEVDQFYKFTPFYVFELAY